MKKLGILLSGRLGNHMFEAVAAKNIAKKYGYEFVGMFLNKRDPKYNFYIGDESVTRRVLRNVPLIPLDGEYLSWQTYPYMVNSYIQKGFKPVPDTSNNVILRDLFQDAQYIDENTAFDLFKPYPSIIEQIKKLYGDLNDYVCINVRRGDYIQLADNYWNEKDIQIIIDKYFSNDKILFVSDDIQWCKEHFKGDRYKFADKSVENKVEVDLYIQTQCRDNVISNSTFSWWGAYLNQNSNKKIIWPTPWFKNWPNKFEQIIPKDNRWIAYKWKYEK